MIMCLLTLPSHLINTFSEGKVKNLKTYT